MTFSRWYILALIAFLCAIFATVLGPMYSHWAAERDANRAIEEHWQERMNKLNSAFVGRKEQIPQYVIDNINNDKFIHEAEIKASFYESYSSSSAPITLAIVPLLIASFFFTCLGLTMGRVRKLIKNGLDGNSSLASSKVKSANKDPNSEAANGMKIYK